MSALSMGPRFVVQLYPGARMAVGKLGRIRTRRPASEMRRRQRVRRRSARHAQATHAVPSIPSRLAYRLRIGSAPTTIQGDCRARDIVGARLGHYTATHERLRSEAAYAARLVLRATGGGWRRCARRPASRRGRSGRSSARRSTSDASLEFEGARRLRSLLPLPPEARARFSVAYRDERDFCGR